MKIGLCGKLRSGKDSVANYASTFYDFMTYAFGDELKRDYHSENPHIPWIPKPRSGYQEHGQEKRAIFGDDVWINEVFRSIASHSWPERIMVTDVRQLNEVERLKTEGFTLIRITAPDDVRVKRAIEAGDAFSEADLEHITEKLVDGFDCDYTLDNNGTLLDLYSAFDEIMKDLGGSKCQM